MGPEKQPVNNTHQILLLYCFGRLGFVLTFSNYGSIACIPQKRLGFVGRFVGFGTTSSPRQVRRDRRVLKPVAHCRLRSVQKGTDKKRQAQSQFHVEIRSLPEFCGDRDREFFVLSWCLQVEGARGETSKNLRKFQNTFQPLSSCLHRSALAAPRGDSPTKRTKSYGFSSCVWHRQQVLCLFFIPFPKPLSTVPPCSKTLSTVYLHLEPWPNCPDLGPLRSRSKRSVLE